MLLITTNDECLSQPETKNIVRMWTQRDGTVREKEKKKDKLNFRLCEIILRFCVCTIADADTDIDLKLRRQSKPMAINQIEYLNRISDAVT